MDALCSLHFIIILICCLSRSWRHHVLSRAYLRHGNCIVFVNAIRCIVYFAVHYAINYTEISYFYALTLCSFTELWTYHITYWIGFINLKLCNEHACLLFLILVTTLNVVEWHGRLLESNYLLLTSAQCFEIKKLTILLVGGLFTLFSFLLCETFLLGYIQWSLVGHGGMAVSFIIGAGNVELTTSEV